MKILAISDIPGDPQQSAAARKALLHAEVQGAWDLQQSDFIREIYVAPQLSAVVLVLEADDLQSAQSRLRTLPMVEQSLVTFTLSRLAPYDKFSMLMADKS